MKDIHSQQGYRITSRKHRMATRIDREDWKEHCEEEGFPVDADWYRRCVSKDTIIVARDQIKEIGTSCNDTTGYVHI